MQDVRKFIDITPLRKKKKTPIGYKLVQSEPVKVEIKDKNLPNRRFKTLDI